MRLDARFAAVSSAALVLAISLGGAALQRGGGIASEVEACYASGCFDSERGARLAELARPFVSGSRFEGRLNVEAPPRAGDLNIYVAKGGLRGRLSAIRCNCAYVGSDIIVCDDAFMRSFQSAFDFSRGSIYGQNADAVWKDTHDVLAQVNERVSRVLLSWLLGHEIGHAVLHEVSLDHRLSLTEEQEAQADRFFIDHAFLGASAQSRQDLYFGLSQIIFTMTSLSFRSAGDGAGRAVIAPSADGIHPPWLVRALRLGKRMAEIDPDGRDPRFFDGLAAAVDVRRGGTSAGSMCAFENLREVAADRQRRRSETEPSTTDPRVHAADHAPEPNR